uniref:Uncharacterized protein n=1 Tax=Magallana gigas TaxID=29159 RepID=K1QGH5_MAGGI
MLIATENEASRLVERLERGIRRIVNSSGHGQQHRQQQPQEPAFQYAHTKVAADPRQHYTIVPSWAVRGEDKRGPCNICLEQDTHLQIKCTRCNNQCVCCKCVVGVYLSNVPASRRALGAKLAKKDPTTLLRATHILRKDAFNYLQWKKK